MESPADWLEAHFNRYRRRFHREEGVYAVRRLMELIDDHVCGSKDGLCSGESSRSQRWGPDMLTEEEVDEWVRTGRMPDW